MSYPTVLGPWFVVQRLADVGCDGNEVLAMHYYATSDEDRMFTPNRRQALLFMSLGSAARVAAAEVAEVRVLTTKEEAAEFGRD